jgi:hypothetical protein
MTETVFVLVVGARFLVPLLIPRFPLPAILAALVLDGVDQTIFQAFGFDPPGYQGYDKAMDVYYLAIAYLSTMRNWTSRSAFEVSRFLYYYRLAGVVLFEYSGSRAVLLIFPNTFEYFFIAYEIVRLGWDPARRTTRTWIVTAAAIWIFVKLPQEYWIHVAQLDVTDTVAAYPGPCAAIAVAALVVAVGVGWWLRPRIPTHEHPWRLRADPLPAGIDTPAQQQQWRATHGRLLSATTVEKVLLISFVCLIYGRILPGRRSSDLALFIGVAAFVVVNAAVGLWAARRGRGTESVAAAFLARVLMNAGLVLVAQWLLHRIGGDLNLAIALFFMLLLSLITLLDDRYRPVLESRAAAVVPVA